MRLLTAKVVNGSLDIPPDLLREGETVTLLVKDEDGDFFLTEAERRDLLEGLDEADAGKDRDGWELLAELKR